MHRFAVLGFDLEQFAFEKDFRGRKVLFLKADGNRYFKTYYELDSILQMLSDLKSGLFDEPIAGDKDS